MDNQIIRDRVIVAPWSKDHRLAHSVYLCLIDVTCVVSRTMAQGKVALLACGSFNPPTYMHLRMFEIARDYLQAQGTRVVGGVMSPVHDAYGKKDLASATHRCEMLRLALRSSDWIKMSEWEVQQEGWTRTRAVLEHHQRALNAALRGELPRPPAWSPDALDVNSHDQTDNIMSNGERDAYNNNLNNNNREGGGGGEVTVKLLCGADLLESFATPGLWADEDLEAILGGHGLVVVSRAGTDPSRFIYESDVLYRYRRHVTLLTNWVTNEVSSTALRRLLRRGESIKYLTEDGVAAYASAHRLYGALPSTAHIEYNILPDLTPSPQDISMSPQTPTENYKNIFISIRDRPSIVDETITVKRPKKINFMIPNTRTDNVSPVYDVRPKMAYLDASPSHPGKAVKIVANASKTHTVLKSDAEVSFDLPDCEDVWERRVSAGNVEADKKGKITSSRSLGGTIKKIDKKFSMGSIRKSLSEVGRLSEKVRAMSVKEKHPEVKYKTRSCNDIVKLVLTKHGIHVISDTEAIV